MKCVLCKECREHPYIKGACIYGGPFAGFIDRTTEEGLKLSEAMAERATRENYVET